MESRVEKLLASANNYLDKIQCDVDEGSPPFKCAVATCKNKFVNFEDHQKSLFKFHNFPKIRKIAAKWKAICRIPKNTPVNTLKICSAHFSVDDYVRNFKAEFLNPALKRSLKEEALPTCFVLPLEVNDEEGVNIKSENEEGDVDVGEVVLTDTYTPPPVQSSVGTKTIKDELALLNKQVITAQNKLYKKKKILKQKQTILKSVKNSLAKLKRESNRNVGKNLSSFLSKAQIQILKGEKKVYWSDDDLANAFSLRHMGGKDFYLYLKNTLNYPLPALSCVQIWAGN